jgi:hypothetical protein
MFLIGEIAVEILMIVAVVVAIACLAYVLQGSLREQVYLRRLQRERREARSALLHVFGKPSASRTAAPRESRDASAPLREKRA